MNLGKIARFSEEIRPQTARYAMKREVAAVQPVFPLSMSDFKPGDKEYCQHTAAPEAAPFHGAAEGGLRAVCSGR